jgi:hypothetical protein
MTIQRLEQAVDVDEARRCTVGQLAPGLLLET